MGSWRVQLYRKKVEAACWGPPGIKKAIVFDHKPIIKAEL